MLCMCVTELGAIGTGIKIKSSFSVGIVKYKILQKSNFDGC
jgi:hypothetical protein